MRYFDMLPERAFRKSPFKNRPDTLEGGGPSAPAPPDPYATADATTKSNKDTATYNKALNQNNYSNPFGSQQSKIIGTDPKTGAPIYQTNITANPQLQQALTAILGQTGNSANTLNGAMSGIASLGGQYKSLYGQLSPSSAQDYANKGQAAYYKSATGYLDPQYAQQQTSLDAKLANQGITPGSEAYNNAEGNLQRDKTFAYNQAANSAITQGTQLGLQQLQGQEGVVNTQGQNLGAQGALYGQQAGLSQMPYQNLQTIAQMIPGYSGPAQSSANPADIGKYMQNAYQGKLNVYNADTASNNQQNSEYASLAAIAAEMYFSDRRLKRNIQFEGVLRNGVRIYSYKYVWDDSHQPERLGAMADEVAELIPDAVCRHHSGFDMVDYGRVMYG